MKVEYITFNGGELCLPVDALEACYHQGSCDSDVEFWENQIDWENQTMNADAIRAELDEYGAWDENELKNDHENRLRILWIAAGNYHDMKGA